MTSARGGGQCSMHDWHHQQQKHHEQQQQQLARDMPETVCCGRLSRVVPNTFAHAMCAQPPHSIATSCSKCSRGVKAGTMSTPAAGPDHVPRLQAMLTPSMRSWRDWQSRMPSFGSLSMTSRRWHPAQGDTPIFFCIYMQAVKHFIIHDLKPRYDIHQPKSAVCMQHAAHSNSQGNSRADAVTLFSI